MRWMMEMNQDWYRNISTSKQVQKLGAVIRMDIAIVYHNSHYTSSYEPLEHHTNIKIKMKDLYGAYAR